MANKDNTATESLSTRDDYTVAPGEGGGGSGQTRVRGPGASRCRRPRRDSQAGVCWKWSKTVAGLRILSAVLPF